MQLLGPDFLHPTVEVMATTACVSSSVFRGSREGESLASCHLFVAGIFEWLYYSGSTYAWDFPSGFGWHNVQSFENRHHDRVSVHS